MSTVSATLRTATLRLATESPRLEAELLLAQALGQPRSWLYGHGDAVLDAASSARYEALLARRVAGEPLALITGRREFWSLELAVSADTLIPRPETECLVELALARIPADVRLRVLDLGTGSGAIALAIAGERPLAEVTAIDVSAAALAVARANAEGLRLTQLTWRESDWYSALAGQRFALIVSNPPYLAEDDPHLGQGDLRFEPRSALVSGAQGLDAIRRIVAGAAAHLDAGGWLLVEHGWQQGAAVRALFGQAGFAEVRSARDLEDRERVTFGRWR